MASDKLGTVPAPQMHAALNHQPQLVFPEAFGCGPLRLSAADPATKVATRELTASFLDHRHYFQQHPPPQAAEFHRHQWNVNSRSSGGDASEEEDEDDEDDDDDEEDKEEEEETNLANIVTVAQVGESSRNETHDSSQKMKNISILGFKEGNVAQSVSERNSENNSGGDVRNARGGGVFYMQCFNRAEGPSSSSRQKEMLVADECGFSGKRESSFYCDGDPLRTIFSDPITGSLMDDAMILPCGHSFGTGGIQQIIRTHLDFQKTCYTCSLRVSEECISPNLCKLIYPSLMWKRTFGKYNWVEFSGNSKIAYHQSCYLRWSFRCIYFMPIMSN